MRGLSNRKQDSVAEQALGQFLDCYFYPRLTGRADFQWHRHADKKTQIQGIDVGITFNSTNQDARELFIDEKAALQYINNRRLKTFALELTFINSTGIESDGWFINDDLKTDYYLLIWPEASIDGVPARAVDLGRLSRDDFTQLLACFISKRRLETWLADQGLDAGKLKEIAVELRAITDPNKPYKEILDDGLSIYCSAGAESESNPAKHKLVVRPIDILVDRSILIELSHDPYLVTKNELKRMSDGSLVGDPWAQ